MNVLDKLAAHARADHAVGKWNRIVAMAIGALVAATIWLGSHVNANKRRLEARLERLLHESQVI
eukprot:CAMPEP_0197620272 /NCGR_PEP_ID=MMETSP1338-20131121/1128_1 /TAXON_ID=43686 ORGANISM="Pelagodinium beii, Strain RCC1491" /NCGR_SAMPLE_ID=MMETSP1338 /ASSEMBLY_ACC=CAM_ASM_000754 /LENGTH=63 /DNA_ID=CAMNT_0043189407 /DNA_START=29 /DNA_END=217 /DNA_ORIENTATION=+